VILIGRRADRDRLRPRLVAAGMEIVSEQTEAPEGIARADVDAVVHAPAGTSRSNAVGTNFVPGATAGGATAGAATIGDATVGAATGGDADLDPLTARELEVLALVAEGLPNKMIATALGISDQTVKFHVAAIIGKLGAANRTDAVRRAVRRGLVAL
jgi:DNA-binding CsgD family transcriptional regulator